MNQRSGDERVPVSSWLHQVPGAASVLSAPPLPVLPALLALPAPPAALAALAAPTEEEDAWHSEIVSR